MVEQDKVKCSICGGINVVVRDVEKEIIECLDCKLIIRPLKLEGEDAKRICSNPYKK